MPGPTEPAWIAWVMLLPFAAATASFLTWRLGAKIGLSAAFINAIVSVTLVVQVGGGGTVTHHVAGWGTPLGIELRADGLACLMLILTATVGMAVSVYASGYFPAESRQQRFFWPLWLLLLGGLNALFLSADVFNLYVTLEIVGLAAVALASLPGTAAALNAAMRYLLVSLLGSLFYLLGVSLLYAEHQLLDLVALGSVMEPGAITWLALALMTAGLLMKAAVFPLHFWLPPAHANAPAPVSAILSALVVKASFYLLLRLWFELFAPAVTGTALHWIGALGAAAILWGSLLACYQRRLKLLVAYSTVAQLGYLFVAFPLVTATEGIGYGGAVYFALSHGFAKAAMFFSAGTMLHAAGHDRIDDLSEIAPHMPVSMLAFGLSGLSLMGLPPSGGFIAKWMLLEATLQSGLWWLTATILIGGLLAGVYVYRVVSCAFAPGTARSFAPTLRRLEWSALVLAVIACLLGLTPNAPLALVSEGPDLSAQLFGGAGS
ncbi:complex I subunit 5 family protein [Ruegeria arenilitoris]|uniref:complex I subunit 5 family protein n=1 Tax=Ruegeria arenilitoris TaxID=1173585 RepID=UPI00147B1A0D|nr:proton-conducting transporter membrane subunit [Ruegeria arenilitoris]